MMSFWKKLIIDNLVCIKTCYSFKPAKHFQWAKQNPKIVIFWNHLDWCLGACWPKLSIFREHFLSHNPFFGQNWYEQPWTKSQPFSKQFSHKKWCFNLEGHRWHALLPEINRPWERKKWTKKKENDCHIMHLENLISLNKSQESQVKKNTEKIMININRFSLARNYSSV